MTLSASPTLTASTADRLVSMLNGFQGAAQVYGKEFAQVFLVLSDPYWLPCLCDLPKRL